LTSGTTATAEVTVVVPEDLTTPALPLFGNDQPSGILGSNPGGGWAPKIKVDDPAVLTGEYAPPLPPEVPAVEVARTGYRMRGW